MINSTTSKQIFPQAQLKIFYTGQKYPIAQGKVFLKNDKHIYLADMDQEKLFNRMEWIKDYGGGYAIADQLLEAFKKKDIDILYRRKDLGTIYKADRRLFLRKAQKISFGGHRQWLLPLIFWGYSEYFDDEPKNLPSMSVDQWLKPPVRRLHIDPEQQLNARLRLKEMFQQKMNSIDRKGQFALG